MTPEEYTSYYPAELSIGSDPSLVYKLSLEQCAQPVNTPMLSSDEPIIADGEKSYALSTLDLSRDDSPGLPVYKNGVETGVPTGSLFLRLAPQQDIHSIEPDLESLGFRITAVPSYAKHTAWIARKDNDISLALHGLLAIVQNIRPAHIEAQLLRPSSTKSS